MLKKICLISIILIFFSSFCYAEKIKIIYIPLDNRPVCTDFAKDTLEAANCEIIMPPEKFIASREATGNPDEIWKWLEKKAVKADAAVISTDSLIYGGLVASRTHNYSKEILKSRVERLNLLSQILPIKIYAFSTIMRTPRASFGNVEPPYYSTVGPTIFKYSQLYDKADSSKLNFQEQLTKQAIERNMKKSDLGDWLERREKNLTVNLELTKMAARKHFHYLAIGKDDNAPLSATHMEARKISWEIFGLPKEELQILPGVDQLGLLLLTRAYNDIMGKHPKVYAMYSEGAGANTLPQYSDTLLYDSVPQQIIAAGGIKADDITNADLVLALNTPYNGIMQDSTADSNQFFAAPENKRFINKLQYSVDNGYKVSLADISYSNGADNGFMHALNQTDIPYKIIAYNGWNTADNAVGYAIAQGMMALDTPEKERINIIKTRFIDDWFYQSNARRKISDGLEAHSREDLKYQLLSEKGPILEAAEVSCQTLANRYDFTKGSKFKLSFPWNRLFEVNVEIKRKK